MQIEGVNLKPAQSFKYLGYKSTADGNTREAIVDRMQAAAFRYSSLGHIWKSKKIGQTLKLRLYSAAIISVLTYGCSGWELTPERLTHPIIRNVPATFSIFCCIHFQNKR